MIDYNSIYNPYQRNFNPQMTNPQLQQNIVPPLSGRVVQSENEITANDVNMSGAASFFPLMDESAIIVRRWNANGTISSAVYQKTDGKPTEQKEDALTSLLEPITAELAAIRELLASGKKGKKNDKSGTICQTDDNEKC